MALTRTNWPDVDDVIALNADAETRGDPGDHQPMSAARVLDEEMPRLMAYNRRVDRLGSWVARDRAAGVRAAETAGAGAILLDDGFQNPSVAKDLSLVVVDAARGWGNGRAIPAGPLREGVEAGLSRAHLLLSIGDAPAQDAFVARWSKVLGDLPRLRGELRPLSTGMPWAGIRALAFAGIGQPERFFATLRALGTEVVATMPLDDHQPFTPALLQRLERDAKRLVAQLVTTEKDAVRLPPLMRSRVLTLPVRLQIEDWGALDAALDQLLQPQGSDRP